MELKTDAAPVLDAAQIDPVTFELARAAGLSVCTGAQSTFNRQVMNFADAVRAKQQAEIDALRLEVAELRQVRAGRRPVKSFNDDDIYVYDAETFELVEQIGSGSPRRSDIKNGYADTKQGTRWDTGMSAKNLPLWVASRPCEQAGATVDADLLIELQALMLILRQNGPAGTYRRALAASAKLDVALGKVAS